MSYVPLSFIILYNSERRNIDMVVFMLFELVTTSIGICLCAEDAYSNKVGRPNLFEKYLNIK